MALHNRNAKVGDQFTLGGNTFTVHHIYPAGSAGRSYSAGPQIAGWIRPGGYGVTIDDGTSGVEWVEPTIVKETAAPAADVAEPDAPVTFDTAKEGDQFTLDGTTYVVHIVVPFVVTDSDKDGAEPEVSRLIGGYNEDADTSVSIGADTAGVEWVQRG